MSNRSAYLAKKLRIRNLNTEYTLIKSSLILQVKQGAENMLSQFSGTKDKKLLVEAEELLQDSKAKIEYLKMRILKIKQQATAGGDIADKSERSVEVTPVEERIEELRHHLRIESACLEGAKNVLKILNAAKSQEKKALQDAQQNLYESSQKLDLIRHSLELVRQDLPPSSHKSQVGGQREPGLRIRIHFDPDSDQAF
jgi:hypothetical protein